MKTKTYLFILSMLCACFCAPLTVKGQVKIGGSDTPAQGAVLDLKTSASESYSGGLLLPNVFIKNVGYIPASFTDANEMAGFDPAIGVDENQALKGMIVYNTNDDVADGEGVYVWDGDSWQMVSGGGTPVEGAFGGDKDVVIAIEGGTFSDLGGADALNTKSGDYKFALINDAGGAATLVATDAATGLFSVTFTGNETGSNRTAIVRVTSPSRAYQDYYLNQTGMPVVVIPPTPGTGNVTGLYCYDIAMGNNGGDCGSLTTRQNLRPNFSVPQIYTFIGSGYITNVRVTTEETGVAEGKIFSSAIIAPSGTTNQWTITVKMKESLLTDAANLTTATALKGRVIVVYYDGTQDVYVSCNVTVQDCSCCGAKTNNSGGWLEFMCHNLGANTSLNPFTPDQALHGAKYRFGAKEASVSMEDDQSSGSVSGWNSKPIQNTGNWDLIDNNPCPAGWTVPTQGQWQAVVDNNTKTYMGTWSNNSYNSGLMLGTSLFLPAAGWRGGGSSGTLATRGVGGFYWSSTQINNTNGYGFEFSNNRTITNDTNGRDYGLSVRCVAE